MCFHVRVGSGAHMRIRKLNCPLKKRLTWTNVDSKLIWAKQKIETNQYNQYKLRFIHRKSLENISCKYHVLIYVDNREGSSCQVTPATQVVFDVQDVTWHVRDLDIWVVLEWFQLTTLKLVWGYHVLILISYQAMRLQYKLVIFDTVQIMCGWKIIAIVLSFIYIKNIWYFQPGTSDFLFIMACFETSCFDYRSVEHCAKNDTIIKMLWKFEETIKIWH